jgi:hypothetical protein
MGRKKQGFDPSIPIDAKQPPRRKKKGKKKQPSRYLGLGLPFLAAVPAPSPLVRLHG